MPKEIWLIPLLVVFLGLYLLARNKSGDMGEAISEYGFIVPSLAPLGLYLSEKIRFRLSAAQDRKIRANLVELFGHRRADEFYEIHVGQKYVLMVVGLFLVAFIAITGDVDPSFGVFGLTLVGLIYFWVDRQLETKIKLKKRDILIDLPVFTNTLALLINAGLPFVAAIQRIVKDADLTRPLYKELSYTLAEIQGGKPIAQAYEDFAQRIKVPEVTRFISVVLQNLNRGGADFVHVLRVLSQESWQRRRDIARKQGEEASSKLIFPMVMVFIAVAIIVLAPAVITMSGN